MIPSAFLAALRATSPGPALIELRTGELVLVSSSDDWSVTSDGRYATAFPHPRGVSRCIGAEDVAAVAKGGDASTTS